MNSEGCILVVEDETDVRASIADEFRGSGFTVLEAGNVAGALQVVAVSHVDAIIVDMKMEDQDERAGLRLLRAAVHYGMTEPSVPIIVFTGYESYENCVAAIKAGASDYVPKGRADEPTLRWLVRRCRELIDGKTDGAAEPDKDWLARNYGELVERYGGKRVAVLEPSLASQCDLNTCELDGFAVIAADTYEELKRAILKEPIVRDALPFVALVPKREVE